MQWVVQSSIASEEGFGDLLDTLERMEIPFDVVSVEGDKLVPEIEPDGAVMIIGTYRLSRIARSRGWYPGTFLNEKHDHRVWQQEYGRHLLNADAVSAPLGLIEPVGERFFVRPAEDSKTFSGKVFSQGEFATWRSKVLSGEVPGRLAADIVVSWAPLKQIYRESRCFVVAGEVVTQSTYKVAGRAYMDGSVDPDTLAFAREMVALWQPAEAFVLDVALTGAGFRVVEINNINCSGFYDANVPKLVMALEMLAERSVDDTPVPSR